ncbi:Site-specific DNA recombinase [Colwellia chukchiensis]|uniref:Site-specific DNA recombinase n=1 Tax=Colwellia chukchiensis TaxID=641665 RepID=A0A1H7MMH2_9GAMM|nr:recombinase family protein [Colwellia chukchiensis]SEL12279.1 Site-specific DNA recombinase [Colwellia chukchiensis]
MKTKKLQKAIALTRAATEVPATTNGSIEGQKKSILKWADENGCTIEKFYHEKGVGAFNGKRPILKLIKKDIIEGVVSPDAMVVYSYSRFTRNAEKAASFKSFLTAHDISLISVTEPMSEDEDTTFISRTIIDMVNELHSHKSSKAIQHRLNDTAKKGYFTGGRIPFGYKTKGTHRKKLVINPIESAIVKKIFSLAISPVNDESRTLASIASELNTLGLSRRGKVWDYKYVARIIKNTIYKGFYLYGKHRTSRYKSDAPIIVNAPSIVSSNVFDKAQLILGKTMTSKE